MQHILLAQMSDPIQWFILVFFLLASTIVLAVFAQFFSLWLQCKVTHAGIGILDLVKMRLRRVNSEVIVRSKIMTVQAGLTKKYPISTRALEAHYLAGGNVPNVIRALIAAEKADIPLDWNTAQAIDLAGRDILEAVKTSVYPKVIDCPDPKRTQGTLSAVAADGVEGGARGGPGVELSPGETAARARAAHLGRQPRAATLARRRIPKMAQAAAKTLKWET